MAKDKVTSEKIVQAYDRGERAAAVELARAASNDVVAEAVEARPSLGLRLSPIWDGKQD